MIFIFRGKLYCGELPTSKPASHDSGGRGGTSRLVKVAFGEAVGGGVPLCGRLRVKDD